MSESASEFFGSLILDVKVRFLIGEVPHWLLVQHPASEDLLVWMEFVYVIVWKVFCLGVWLCFLFVCLVFGRSVLRMVWFLVLYLEWVLCVLLLLIFCLRVFLLTICGPCLSLLIIYLLFGLVFRPFLCPCDLLQGLVLILCFCSRHAPNPSCLVSHRTRVGRFVSKCLISNICFFAFFLCWNDFVCYSFQSILMFFLFSFWESSGRSGADNCERLRLNFCR